MARLGGHDEGVYTPVAAAGAMVEPWPGYVFPMTEADPFTAEYGPSITVLPSFKALPSASLRADRNSGAAPVAAQSRVESER